MKHSKAFKSINGKAVFSPLRNCILAGMIVFSILLNAFVPRFAISQEEASVLSTIMQQQSTLLRFFSLSSLPLDIVNQLFSETQSLKSDVKTSLPEKKKERKANSASDYSIINFQTNSSLIKSNSGGSEKGSGSIFQNFGLDENFVRGSPINLSPHLFIFVSFLIFFFLLPRSSVGDYYALISKKYSTQLGFPSWVFLLSNYKFLGRKCYEII